MATKRRDARSVLRDAIADVREHGFVSQFEIDRWMRAIRAAAVAAATDDETLTARVRGSLSRAFARALTPTALRKRHGAAVKRFDVRIVEPQLRADLERRILAASQLIKLDRDKRIAQTLQRFAGWASSIPAGGSAQVDARKVAEHIREPVRDTSFEARRVEIDQGFKLVSSINAVIAEQEGAIAAIWHDHGKVDKRYHARPEHLRRTGKVFAIKDSWATKQGLIKRGESGWTTDVEQPGEEVFCRCWWQYIDDLSELPADMLTARGRAELAKAAV